MKEYTPTEAAEMLNVCRGTIHLWIKQGIIKARKEKKIKKTYYYIPEEEVLRLKKLMQEA